ncbi:hypothetical protein [Kitasatospora sp. NPDC057500]|uniref:hypothetical protein n=1 Tax=Kitasatospora sp. NPDC057500 TaxID=3346151 RepID=UPI003679481C
METSRIGLPPLAGPAERPADEARPPAGPGTWVAAILVCLVAGASPIIGFLSFAR